MFQIDKSVNFMLKIQNTIYRESVNVTLSPFSLEILSFSILSGVTGKCLEELTNCLFGKDVNFDEIFESIRCFKLIINHIKTIENVDFRMNNFIYVSDKFEIIQNYIDFVYTNLDTRVKQINFTDETLEVYNTIDQDIRDATCGKVDKVLKYLPTVSKLMLVNCISFSGELKFKPSNIYDGKFKLATNEEVDVRFTTQEGNFKFIRNSEFTFVELPYKNEAMNLCLILPNDGVSIRDILTKLNYHELTQLFCTSVCTQVSVHLPVLKLQSNLDLAMVLQLCGICKVFEEENANFVKMASNSKGLYLESVLTNSELNLQNLAKDTVVQQQASNPMASVLFNKPFIYFVNCDMKRLQSIILFSGVVNNIDT